MNQITDAMEMVSHLSHPAFCVRDGVIVHVNTAAAGRMIETGTAVSQLLKTGADEYSNFTGGHLYLTLTVCGQELGFSVSRKHDFDLFHQIQDTENHALQAISLAARELREPLASIMISAGHLFPDGSQDPAVNTQLSHINRGLFQMLRLISNMSDADRYTTGPVSMETKNISAFLDEVFAKAATLVEHSGVQLTYTGISNAIYSLVNTEMLERAVLNIISNSLKFMPNGGTIQAKLTSQGQKLYLSIQDSGPGIPESARADLFSRYTREPGLEDGRFGIGLGLVLIRSTAQHHGGTVLVDHPTETGTRVTMTLAIRSGDANHFRSPVLKVDYAGERDHGLLELSDVLPADLYKRQ